MYDFLYNMGLKRLGDSEFTTSNAGSAMQAPKPFKNVLRGIFQFLLIFSSWF